MSLGDEAYLLERSSMYRTWYISQLIPNPVTESAMEMEPLTAAHKVARIGSKRLESKAMLV